MSARRNWKFMRAPDRLKSDEVWLPAQLCGGLAREKKKINKLVSPRGEQSLPLGNGTATATSRATHRDVITPRQFSWPHYAYACDGPGAHLLTHLNGHSAYFTGAWRAN